MEGLKPMLLAQGEPETLNKKPSFGGKLERGEGTFYPYWKELGKVHLLESTGYLSSFLSGVTYIKYIAEKLELCFEI